MPRTDSIASSGGSLTSDEEDTTPPPAVVGTTRSAATMVGTATRTGTTRSAATEKFRQSVFKIIQMHKMPGVASGRRPAGSEPGADPRRPSANQHYAHIREHCEIEVTDYSPVSVNVQQYDNRGFIELMESTKGVRPAWAKVRWINIGGISWDVLSSLAIAYDLHPLSLENVLNGRPTTRSKADYYRNWLFIHILCQTLTDSTAEASPLQQALGDHVPRTASPVPMSTSDRASLRKNRKTRPSAESDPEKATPTEQRENTLSTLSPAKLSRLSVETKNLFLYLCRDGTVISIHAADRGFGDQIYRRLKQRDTILRATSDASLLLHALLDLVVDRAINIVEKFRENIRQVETEVLERPKMRSVRELHLLSGELTQRRRELEPVKTLIYGLRRYDKERCVAIAESAGAAEEAQGFLSHKAKIYLADVYEHAEFILASFEMFESISENLINYTFNQIAYETNEVMRKLTLATIIFLPLTLLTGYFGMNFDPFPAVNQNTDVLFWEIALPVMVVCSTLFLWRDMIRGWHKIQKTIFPKH